MDAVAATMSTNMDSTSSTPRLASMAPSTLAAIAAAAFAAVASRAADSANANVPAAAPIDTVLGADSAPGVAQDINTDIGLLSEAQVACEQVIENLVDQMASVLSRSSLSCSDSHDSALGTPELAAALRGITESCTRARPECLVNLLASNLVDTLERPEHQCGDT